MGLCIITVTSNFLPICTRWGWGRGVASVCLLSPGLTHHSQGQLGTGAGGGHFVFGSSAPPEESPVSGDSWSASLLSTRHPLACPVSTDANPEKQCSQMTTSVPQPTHSCLPPLLRGLTGKPRGDEQLRGGGYTHICVPVG